MKLFLRGKIWYLRKSVPSRYHRVETKRDFWISLHTDSELVARQKAEVVWQEQINAWEAKLAGDEDDAVSRLEAARNLARMRGMRYLPTAKVASLPRDALLDRIEAIPVNAHPIEAESILGAPEDAKVRLSKVLNIYWNLTGDRLLEKSMAPNTSASR